ncbi:MAG: hypothetical protein IJH78_05955 [Clostridia bacterium]|nr:hypothetical protein [Clostridia bacterium]
MKESILKQAGYLKGILEGMRFEDEAQGRLMNGIVELLSLISDKVDSIDEVLTDLNDYVESIDDSLSDLEEEYSEGDFFGDEEFDDEEEYDDEDSTEEDPESVRIFGGDALRLLRGDEESRSARGVVCPECGRFFFIKPGDAADAEYMCPHPDCGKRIKPVTPDPGVMGTIDPV